MFPWKKWDWDNRPDEQKRISLELPDGDPHPLTASPGFGALLTLVARPVALIPP